MEQKATVLKTEGHNALVAVPRPSACGENCAACGGGCTARGHQAWVKNPLHAKCGDLVLLSAESDHLLRAALLVYALPLFIFFVIYGTIYTYLQQESLAALCAAISFAASFFVLKRFDKLLTPKTEIIKILSTKERKNTNGI